MKLKAEGEDISAICSWSNVKLYSSDVFIDVAVVLLKLPTVRFV